MVRNSVVWVVTFLLVAAAGALSWLASHASLPGWLIGQEAGYDLAHSLLFDFFGMPACMIVAAVAGFVVWKGFWLWGFAAAFPIPAVDTFLVSRLVERGLIEPSEVWVSVSFSFMVCAELAVACTVTSALGAGLRVAGRWLTSRPASSAA